MKRDVVVLPDIGGLACPILGKEKKFLDQRNNLYFLKTSLHYLKMFPSATISMYTGF